MYTSKIAHLPWYHNTRFHICKSAQTIDSEIKTVSTWFIANDIFINIICSPKIEISGIKIVLKLVTCTFNCKRSIYEKNSIEFTCIARRPIKVLQNHAQFSYPCNKPSYVNFSNFSKQWYLVFYKKLHLVKINWKLVYLTESNTDRLSFLMAASRPRVKSISGVESWMGKILNGPPIL